MREKGDMRDRECVPKKKEESKKVFEKRKKLSVCYGCGSHVYQFIEKNEFAAK